MLFSFAAEAWLKSKTAHLSPRSVIIERANLKHLAPAFGKLLLCDVTADTIGAYQARRLKEKASPKTINLEVGTVRAILRKHRMWAAIQPDVRVLPTREDIGRALSPAEETALLQACGESRSRSLLPAVTLALSPAMRASEIRLLRWNQIDLARRTVIVGKSKSAAGTGRQLPLNDRAAKVLEFWACLFPDRQPEHYIFSSEKYGGTGEEETFGFRGSVPYDTDPEKPIGHWKEVWEAARIRAGVILYGEPKEGEKAKPLACRFHDLRHTACTRMLEAGVPFSVVSTIMGWSAATTARMVKRYGHIGQAGQRETMRALNSGNFPGVVTKVGTISEPKTERVS
ncbi:MAG: tyrosine-type recombinase/integrase [Acidobacteria bacterium]|nr:tyrosine-type recombinase/integrase [Acidobacteriota bacterium]